MKDFDFNKMSALISQDSYSTVHYVYHILCLIGDVESESLPYRTVPSSSELLVKSSLDELSSGLQ